MATIPIGADRTTAAVRAARRSYRALQNLPTIPLLILGVLASMAAPVLTAVMYLVDCSRPHL